MSEFMKHDADKPNLAILFDTRLALNEVARVMSYGAEKYDRKNWDKVEDRERYIAASLRHISEYCAGYEVDAESDLPHLAHAITSLLFVLELEERDYVE